MTANSVVIPMTYLPAQPIHIDALASKTIEEFFQAEINNPNTRRAYFRGAGDFFHFVSTRLDIPSLDALTPLHVSSWLDDMAARRLAVTTIKVRLAGLRMLFNALVRAQVLRTSPIAVVKGPSHSVTKGKTPVLAGEETAQLLASIDTSTLAGLRDRAIIATMAYTFARIGAITSLEYRHVFRQNRRLWLRLSEKGGKCLDVPCHHKLDHELLAWIEAAGHGPATKCTPLFQSFTWEVTEAPAHGNVQTSPGNGPFSAGRRPRKRRILSGQPIGQAMAWEMLQRRAKHAGIQTRICNHTFRATGITAYLSNGGTIERAAVIAGHASTRTTQLYDRRPDDVTLEEIERIRFA